MLQPAMNDYGRPKNLYTFVCTPVSPERESRSSGMFLYSFSLEYLDELLTLDLGVDPHTNYSRGFMPSC